ncbi:MAG: Sir2 family NAD-dependent protein deacetylase [Trueperaceae bacterium]|nr:Sir2 family NAD-dependent protein deacetylase [Trueperaceae bacterium]
MRDLATIATALRRAHGIVVLTGAGVSVESGLRPFRGTDGWWRGHDPTRLATPEAFAADPALVSEWYDARRLTALAAEPNAGHRAIAALERLVVDAGGRFALLTQNVDGLHRRAGSERLVELHGSITVWRDHRSGRKVMPEPVPFTSHPQSGPDNGWLRPDVVWFGEMLPSEAWSAAEAALELVRPVPGHRHERGRLPAAGLVGRAAAVGAVTVEINIEPTPAPVEYRLIGPSGKVLPSLLEEAFGIEPTA